MNRILLLLFLFCGTLIVAIPVSQPNKPEIPDKYNATLLSSKQFNPIFDGLKMEIFADFNWHDTTKDVKLSDFDYSPENTLIHQIYYNLTIITLFIVSNLNGTCQNVPLYHSPEILFTYPSFMTFVLIVEFNLGTGYVFIETHEKCPYRETISCDQWQLQGSSLTGVSGYNVYLTRSGTPVAFMDNDIMDIIYESFNPGVQDPDRFKLPGLCKPE